jgi:hypothetical protein
MTHSGPRCGCHLHRNKWLDDGGRHRVEELRKKESNGLIRLPKRDFFTHRTAYLRNKDQAHWAATVVENVRVDAVAQSIELASDPLPKSTLRSEPGNIALADPCQIRNVPLRHLVPYSAWCIKKPQRLTIY